jgi:hypothetical protein
MVGNSIKYSTTSSSVLDTNHLWNFYQKKNLGSVTNKPASLVIFPTDANLSHSNIDFSYAGNSISKDANAFKKIQRFSKTSTGNISRDMSYNLTTLKKFDNLYLTKYNTSLSSSDYGNLNQNSYTSLNTILPANTTLLDNKGLKRYLSYSLGIENKALSNNNTLSSLTNDLHYIENVISHIPFNFFFLKKLSMALLSSDVKNFNNSKDKLNILNMSNKDSVIANMNKFSGNKKSSSNILDELISSNINMYNA